MLGLGLLSDESSLRNPAPPGRLTQIVISPTLDIFYKGLTDASRDHLDSCAGCVFMERTID